MPHHIDQRHSIEAGRQVVDFPRRIGCVERRQLLDLGQADCKDVVVDRLLNATKQIQQERLTVT